MKLVFYNIGYARGHTGSLRNYVAMGHHFIGQSKSSQKKILDDVVSFVNQEDPDVFAYAEVQLGSQRNGHFNQHQYLVDELKGTALRHNACSKYGDSFLAGFPFHSGNANGVISTCEADIIEHFLRHSRKKLVLKVSLPQVTIFIVHLPLVSIDRAAQMRELADLVNDCQGDVIVCGDFNIFNGIDELETLTDATELRVLGAGEPTYPTSHPKLQLDVALARFADEAAQLPTLRVGNCAASDHLPIIIEWNEKSPMSRRCV